MSLRDEYLQKTSYCIKDSQRADVVVLWLKRLLAEAQAETVERLANWLYAELKARTWHDKDDATAEVVAQKLRALSPDPKWLNGKITEVVEQVADGVRAWRDRNCIKDSTTYSVLTDVVAAIREGLIYEPLKGHADPEWLERQKQRWELEARQKEARWWRYQSAGFFRMQTNDARLQADERLGALDDQLAALPEVKR